MILNVSFSIVYQELRKLLVTYAGIPDQDPEALCLDGRFNHHIQLQNRLDFIRYMTLITGACTCTLYMYM